MIEIISSQSEDPLPPSPFLSDTGTYDTNQRSSGLGELVSSNPKDPFVWLSRIPYANPSENAKKVMWATFRLSGNFPDQDRTGKNRDLESSHDLFNGLNDSDVVYIEKYQKYLIELESRDTIRRLGNVSGVVCEGAPVSLSEPNEAIFSAIMHHIQILLHK